MLEDAKKFIEDNIDRLDNNDFEKFYARADIHHVKSQVIGDVTSLLLMANIHPLDHMRYVPTSYLSHQMIPENFFIPDHIQFIGDQAFYMSDLTSIVIPSNVKRIGISAFNRCSELHEVKIDEGVEEIEEYSFSQTGIENIIFPSSCRAFNESAFSNSSIKKISLQGAVHLYDYLFANCSELRTVVLSNSLRYIENNVFYRTPKLDSIHYNGTIEEWEKVEKERSWWNGSYITKVWCVDGVKAIL